MKNYITYPVIYAESCKKPTLKWLGLACQMMNRSKGNTVNVGQLDFMTLLQYLNMPLLALLEKTTASFKLLFGKISLILLENTCSPIYYPILRLLLKNAKKHTVRKYKWSLLSNDRNT